MKGEENRGQKGEKGKGGRKKGEKREKGKGGRKKEKKGKGKGKKWGSAGLRKIQGEEK